MTLSKTELRASAIHDVGARIDDELEKAQGLAHAAAGAFAAIGEAVKDVQGLVPQIQGSIDAGNLSMEDGKQQINGLEKAVNALLNLSSNARENSKRLDGVVQGLAKAVEATQKLHRVEQAKIGMVDDQMIPAADPLRQQAQPVKKTIKQQRLEEEAAAKKKVVKKKPAKKKAAKKKAAKKKA
jgi:predicted  nucleic acid-binding Zn-ribbon protein